MDILRCRLNHAGNRDMQLHLEDLTPADIVMLKHLHGADSVTGVEKVREAPRQQREERKRMITKYGERHFRRLFPGSMPRMPLTLGEAGLTEDGRDLEAVEAEMEPEPAPEPASMANVTLPAAVRDRVKNAVAQVT